MVGDLVLAERWWVMVMEKDDGWSLNRGRHCGSG